MNPLTADFVLREALWHMPIFYNPLNPSRWKRMAVRNIVLLILWFSVNAFSLDNSRALGSTPERSKKIILAIGIGKFENRMWHDLRFTAKDAHDVYSYFTASAPRFDHGELITDANKPLSSFDILNAVDRIKSINLSEDDTVILYVSTHGTVAYKENGEVGRFIIASNTDPQNIKETSIDYDFLINKFEGLKSRKKVLILAFCHSGVGKSILTPEMKKSLLKIKSPFFEEPIQDHSEGSIILAASGWREPALEDENLKNDVYTHFLLKGFGEDLNGDGIVSITEAHTYASQATFEYTKGKQRPSAIMELLGSDPIIVSGAARGVSNRASIFSALNYFSKLKITIDGKDYGPLSKGISVPEGDVHMVIRDSDSNKILADRKVNLIAGREYLISNFIQPVQNFYLGVGIRASQFLNPLIREDYAPQAAFGVNLRFVRERTFGINDFLAEITYFPEQFEDVLIKSQSFTQKRQMLYGFLGARKNTAIPSVSDTEMYVAGGLNALLFKRKILELEDGGGLDQSSPYFENSSSRANTAGMSLALGVETLFPNNKLKLSLDARIDAFRNFTAHEDLYISNIGISLNLGTFW